MVAFAAAWVLLIGQELEKGECVQLLRCSGVRSDVVAVDTPGSDSSKKLCVQLTQHSGSARFGQASKGCSPAQCEHDRNDSWHAFA